MILRIAVTVVLILAATSVASGQREPRRHIPAEKFSPRPVQSPLQPQSSSATAATVYSPWVKYCGMDNKNPLAGPACLTVKEARLETGQFIAGAALIEQTGDAKKLLRISLPLGIRLLPGARVFVDNEALKTVPPLQCLPNVCSTDFEVTTDFITKLKRGERLKLEGVHLPGWTVTWPLTEFARALDGPPTDPKTFEEDQRRNATPPGQPK